MHAHFSFRVEKLVDLADLIEEQPAIWGVFASPGDEERAWSHEGLEFVEIVTVLAELCVGAGGRIFWSWEAGLPLWSIEDTAEVPWFPVVDAASMIVESDAWIAPSRAGETFVEACGKHGPFSAVRVAHDADACGVDLGQVCEKVRAVGGNGCEERERLPSGDIWLGFTSIAAG